jgi:hypothetical protein
MHGCPVGKELLNAGCRRDGRTDMTKLLVEQLLFGGAWICYGSRKGRREECSILAQKKKNVKIFISSLNLYYKLGAQIVKTYSTLFLLFTSTTKMVEKISSNIRQRTTTMCCTVPLKSSQLTSSVKTAKTFFVWLIILAHYFNAGVRNSSVSIATRYRFDGPRIESWKGQYFPHLFTQALRPIQIPAKEQRVSFPGVKWPQRDFDHSLLSRAAVEEIKKLYFHSPSKQ